MPRDGNQTTQETIMKRFLFAFALAAVALVAETAQAQVGSYPWRNPSRPTVSPYINLNRGGLAGINYFGLVRPQLDAQKNFMLLNQEIQQVAPDPLGTTTGYGPGYTATGYEGGAAGYMNYLHYYPLMPTTGINPLAPRR